VLEVGPAVACVQEVARVLEVGPAVACVLEVARVLEVGPAVACVQEVARVLSKWALLLPVMPAHLGSGKYLGDVQC